MDKYLETAIELAHEAGKIMKKNFTINMDKEWKEDNTPLTISDNAINDLVLKTLSEKFPKAGIISEEGSIEKEAEYKWVCDPIDGTFGFSHGLPIFVFSLALTKNGESILGVIYDAILDRMLVAKKGQGAFLNGKKIHVSKQRKIDSRSFINLDTYYKLHGMFEYLSKKYECKLPSLYSAVYGSFLVACGQYQGEIYEWEKSWDCAAVKIVVEEAGGKVTDIDGRDQLYDKKVNGFIASNGYIHEELVEACRKVLNK